MSLPAKETSAVDPRERQTAVILESLSEGICRIGPDGRVVYANPAAARLLGRARDELKGRHFRELLYAADRAEGDGFCPIEFVLREGETAHVNTDTFRSGDDPDGFLAEYICVPLFGDGGGIEGAVLSFQDVTERREIETAVAGAREAALEAARTKAAFLANMSHEIRTPLSGIVGAADLLIGADPGPDREKYVRMLRRSAVLLRRIVDDVLDFSKLEAGRFEREKTDFDVRRTVRETAELFRTLVRERDLGIRCEIAPDVPHRLHGDAGSVRQILNNFLSNACKFTEAGEIVVRVKTAGEGVYRFEVVDTGIGIDAETRRKLFRPFTQADASTTRKYGGTGLGLAICRQLTELLGGKIGVGSEPGAGSTFWFECPLEPAREATGGGTAEPGAEEFERHAETARNTDRRAVLVVDDNPANLEMTCEMLRRLGVEPRTAPDGAGAVRLCAGEDFELILMDCQMPEMDGYEATRRIREKKGARADGGPRIVAFTAGVGPDQMARCDRAGMDGHLAKPFTMRDLKELLGSGSGPDKAAPGLDLKEELRHHSLSHIIEPRVLESLLAIETGGKTGFITEILGLFLQNAEERIGRMERAVGAEDRTGIARHAHNVRGSAANAGLSGLSEVFETLEECAREEDWTAVAEAFERAVERFAETKSMIQENTTPEVPQT